MFNVTFAMGSCRHCSPRGHRSLHRREAGRTSHGLRGVAYMALGLLSLISTRAPALGIATEAWNIGEWETAWTKVLTRYVGDSGRIDFASLRQNHTDLDRVVAFIAAVDPDSQPQRFPTSTCASPSTSMRTTPWQCTGSFRPVFPKVSAA